MLSLLTNLCTEKQIRSCAMNQTDLLRILIDELKKPHEGKDERSTNLLGLLINLTNEANDTHHEFYKQVPVARMKDRAPRRRPLLDPSAMRNDTHRMERFVAWSTYFYSIGQHCHALRTRRRRSSSAPYRCVDRSHPGRGLSPEKRAMSA